MLQEYDMPVDDAPADQGDDAPRQSYNFAPGYHGIVYRADVPDCGAGPGREAKTKGKNSKDAANDDGRETRSEQQKEERQRGQGETTHYKLQSMKWGLVPFWTKRNPDYAAVMKTINCRDDSLAQTGGMWSSMKRRKRCVVVAQGFYEWLKSGKEKVPHFVKRKDGKLMCFAGLWDCVQYEDTAEGDKHYTYTIITTDSNKQLKFLHDRMPVILDPASENIKTWLDPGRYEWSKDLQDTLKPFDGELEVYPVSKDVGKVGNNSPTFIIPISSRENKSNIANFFANSQDKTENTEKESPRKGNIEMKEKEVADDGRTGVTASAGAAGAGSKRKADDNGDEGRTLKKEAISPSKLSATKAAKTISSTSNGTKSPAKGKAGGTPKITKFFGNSA